MVDNYPPWCFQKFLEKKRSPTKFCADCTTRKVVDKLLQDSGLDIQRLKIEMELNSLEAIKNAVQSGLGASFLPVVSIERELSAGTIHKAFIADLEVKRELKLITNPSRYTSRASEVFKKYLPNTHQI